MKHLTRRSETGLELRWGGYKPSCFPSTQQNKLCHVVFPQRVHSTFWMHSYHMAEDAFCYIFQGNEFQGNFKTSATTPYMSDSNRK